MKKRNFITKNSIKQKRLYLILIGLAIISFIIGCLFIFVLDSNNIDLINNSIEKYFNNETDYISSFFKILFNNYLYLIIIWIIGISIIGIPLIIIMFLFKSFLFGFSISSLISTYGIKGIIYSLIYIIPNKTIYLIVLLLISFYSISFSLKLIKSFITKTNFEYKLIISKYCKILLISLITVLFVSIYEGIISIYLLKLFNI